VLGVLIGLLGTMFLAVGTATTIELHHFQIGQLDSQLDSARERLQQRPPQLRTTAPGPDQPTQNPTGQPGGGPNPGDASDLADASDLFPNKGQGPGTLNAQVFNHQVSASGYLDSTGTQHRVPDAQQSILARLPEDGKPHTRDLGPLGTYRLTAIKMGRGDVLVTGLPMEGVYATRYKLIGIEAGLGLMALAIATLGGAAIIRIALAPLTRVAETARRVSDLPLHEGEVALLERVPQQDTDPRSEVGQVGAALNRMLGHVAGALSARQASETRLRRFVADASHELRTPLAAIRGYTELTRRHRSATPVQVADALDRVEAAAGRMTTLVEDLLLLARLDAKRPLASEPVDLSAMVIEAVTDAHVAGPGHRWRLDLPEESVIADGDAPRLHQVVANLLANARTHTPAGTTVTTSLTVAPDAVELRVTDDGPGIAPELVSSLFERFTRGDSSRSRRSGSTGLGLAIVDAVVTAHGGAVTVASVPGHTAFLVRLPLMANSQPTLSGDKRPQQPQPTSLLT
jgi:two-component system OmpR family sensor kinase